MENKKSEFVDEVNLEFYNDHFSVDGLFHKYPNVNSVRCEKWYFRKGKDEAQKAKILDFGFGYGREMIYFAENGYEVYGLDISEVAQKRFQETLDKDYPNFKGQIKLSVISPSDDRLPFEDNYFDFIHSNQTIYHLPNEESIRKLIKEWHRVLKPGGKFMFSTVGENNNCIKDAVEVEKNVFEKEYKTPSMDKPSKMRCYLMKDEEAIRNICKPLIVDEVGWFTNNYCGVDGFHWQVLGRKE